MKPLPIADNTRRGPLRELAAGRGSGRTALAALVAALVVGILGMHALASHGTSAATASVSSTRMTTTTDHDAAMAAGGSQEGHAHAAATPLTGQAAVETSADSGSGHDMAGMVMLCVAMLAAAAMTLLVLLSAGVFRALLPATFQPAVVVERALGWVRGTGPPHEWQFSVIRC